MKIDKLEDKIKIPSGVTVDVSDGCVKAKGPKGEVSRPLLSKKVTLEVAGDVVTVRTVDATKREKTILYSLSAHLKNMIKGVTEGHVYKLKICSGHFPMNISVKGSQFEIKNFIGEAVPRRMLILQGADVKMEGDIITVTGIDKEIVAQTAASIESLTRRPGFDNRIFQDGIYITEKDGKRL